MTKLTKTIIDSSHPKQKDYIVWDGEIKGLGCRIWPSGKKTYVFFYRRPQTKKPSYLTIGIHGNITVDTAREIARGWHGDLARNIDPKEQKKADTLKDQQSISFEDFFEIFRQKYILEKHKLSTISRDKNRISKYILPFFGKKIIGEITQEDVLRFVASLNHIKGNCTKCLRLLSVAFNQAELWGYRGKNSNPCKGVPTQKEKMMENYLTDEELKRLESILAERAEVGIVSPYTLAALRLIIYTGCRLGEVLTLKWDEVDLKNSCLRLKDSKTGKRVIPLNEEAKKIIFNINRQEDNLHVFCGGKPRAHLVAIQKTWHRIRQKARIPHIRIHDLRHSFASFAINNGGLDLIEVQKLLGHKDIKTTTRYIHLTDKKMLAATNRIFKEQ